MAQHGKGENITTLLSTKNVAQRLYAGLSTVYSLVRTGDLPAVVVRQGKRKRMLRFRIEAVEQFITSRERGGADAQEQGRPTAK
jgi:excisionase family DNA binding protein